MWRMKRKENSECWYLVVGLRVISPMSLAEEGLSDTESEQLNS